MRGHEGAHAVLRAQGLTAHRRRCPAITEAVRPRNKGEQYPPDPPTVEEIVAVMRAVGDRPDGHRLRALIALLWRAGLRISEALALQESDLDPSRGAVLQRQLGQHANLGITSIYLQGIDRSESSAPCTAGHRRRSPPTPDFS